MFEMPAGWVENSDKEYVNALWEGIYRNGGFCVCKLAKTADNVCPCADFRSGAGCHCDMYVREVM
jgi:ferredoxin-thioredoxin reductase catalytic subunit